MLSSLGAKSMTAIPLVFNNQTEVVILCLFNNRQKFAESSKDIVRKLHKHIEAFYMLYRHTSDLLNETMEHTERIEMVESMAGIDRAILTSVTKEETTQSALRQLGNVIKCETIEILNFNDDSKTFGLTAILENNKSKTVDRLDFNNSNMRSWNDLMFGVPSYYPYLIEESPASDFERRFLERNMNSLLVLPLLIKSELIGAIAFGSMRQAFFSPKQQSIAKQICNQYAVALSNSRLIEQLKNTFLGVINSMVTALDAKSRWTKGHSSRISQYCARLGVLLRLGKEETNDLDLASFFHDIGKIGTDESILNKRGKLSDEEYAKIKEHPEKSRNILKPIPGMENVAIICRHHHERWDGKGYPDGLRGDQIPYLSRVVGMVDAYDAMRSDRPYRKALSFEAAMLELNRCSGGQFDPELTDIFLDMLYDDEKLKRNINRAA